MKRASVRHVPRRSPRLCASAVKGFTLLEVLIAIAVLVLAISAILPLFAVGASAHKRGMDQAHMAWIAPRIAADLQEDLYETSPKDIRDGAWKEYGQTYTYDATYTRLAGSGQGDPTANAAFLLTVQVKWKETGDVRSETFKTLVLRKFPR